MAGGEGEEIGNGAGVYLTYEKFKIFAPLINTRQWHCGIHFRYFREDDRVRETLHNFG